MINILQEDIMKNWEGNIEEPLLSVKCMTYNHEKYIAQTLDGFLMQRTDFPFEVLIHDDASTDGTIDVIKAYVKKFPKILKPIFEEENLYSKNDGSHHKKIDAAIKGAYVAICEGDDYWIDSHKLQMQVGFLRVNPDYGMCYTQAREYIEDKARYGSVIGSGECGLDQLMESNAISNLTVCFRKELYKKYLLDIKPATRSWLAGDYPMWLWFAYNSKIKYFEVVTAVYRILRESASHSVDIEKQISFAKSDNDVRCFFAEKYNCKFNNTFDEYLVRALYYFDIGDRARARKEFLSAKKNIKQRIYCFVCKNILLYKVVLSLKQIKRFIFKY